VGFIKVEKEAARPVRLQRRHVKQRYICEYIAA
jgi:hypothetical protein